MIEINLYHRSYATVLAILAALSVAKQWDAVLAFIVTFVAVRTAYHRFDRTFLDEEEDENGVLCVKKLEAYAKLPVRGSRYAAGFDICSTVDKEIPPNCMELVPTGLAIQTPKNYYGQLVVRSGTCWKHKMDVLAGVIDEDYRGHVQVVLRNTSMTNTFYVKRGEPFAQLILLRCGARIPCIEVNELEKSERGSGGFGSTDVNRKTN